MDTKNSNKKSEIRMRVHYCPATREARGALACCTFALYWISLSSLCSLLFVASSQEKIFFCLLMFTLFAFLVSRYKKWIEKHGRKLLNWVHVYEEFAGTSAVCSDVVSLLFYLSSSTLFISRVLSESLTLTKCFSIFSFWRQLDCELPSLKL